MALTFKAVGTEILAVIERELDREVGGLTQKLEKIVREENKKFFNILVKKGFGKSSQPNLGNFTPSAWQPLSKNYVEFKKKHGLGKGFFRKTGALEGQLKALNPESVLGRPRADGFRSGSRGNPDLVQSTFVRRGKTITQPRLRGRFASPDELFRTFRGQIFINPIPKIKFGLKGKAQEELLFPGNENNIINKFSNPRDRRLRPLLANYIDWWINVHILNKVNSRLSR